MNTRKRENETPSTGRDSGVFPRGSWKLGMGRKEKPRKGKKSKAKLSSL